VITSTALRPDADEVARAVINRVLPVHRAGVHHYTSAELAHEAERLETQEPSAVIRAMRATVDAERAWRRHLQRLGGRG
jgi:hypothetical protein